MSVDLSTATDGKYDQPVEWWAEWAGYLYGAYSMQLVKAAAIDSGKTDGQTVFDILEASALGEHKIGRMGRHVPGTLLKAERRDGWELMAKTLAAAGRQEGVRQAILETVDVCASGRISIDCSNSSSTKDYGVSPR